MSGDSSVQDQHRLFQEEEGMNLHPAVLQNQLLEK
jgi:hypothetical protein